MFNNNLKFCREELGMKQKELGIVLGVSDKTISGWETAQDTIPFKTLIIFCNHYNYSLDFVIGLSRKNAKCKQNIITKEELGSNLKALRNELNMTQQELSDDCGFSRSSYCRFETGYSLINTMTIYTICKKYNISMDYLCNRNDNKYLK